MDAAINLKLRGFTLVELMVGLAIGLVIVAAALAFAAQHMRERRSTVAQSRLTHDLHAAADTVARSLRRAGYWADASAGMASRGAAPNPYALVANTDELIEFRHSRDTEENHAVDSNEQFGFRLHEHTLEMLLGTGGWQALSDPASVRITSFRVTPFEQRIPLDAFCDEPCPARDERCPRQLVRSFAVEMSGQSLADPTLSRSVQTQVRVRNDAISGRCPRDIR